MSYQFEILFILLLLTFGCGMLFFKVPYMSRGAVVMLLFGIAGHFNGKMDVIDFHWEASVYLAEGKYHYNPEISWRNKWAVGPDGETLVGVERFPGSSTVFVALTDRWHLWKSVMLLALLLSVPFYRVNWLYKLFSSDKWINSFVWHQTLAHTAGAFIVYRILFEITFRILS